MNAQSKRISSPRIVPRTLRAIWGKLPHEKPDVCFAWGEGCSKADGHLLNNALFGKRYDVLAKTWDKSFVEELQARGYDLTTLRFEIRKTAEAGETRSPVANPEQATSATQAHTPTHTDTK